jgi:hypothetical protein
MNGLVAALGPAFAAGFAIQRLLEILDSWIVSSTRNPYLTNYKKAILATISLAAGFYFSFGANLHVLQPLGITDAPIIDRIVTAFVVSAGTEGFNSIMKFLGYAKENKKAEAAQGKDMADGSVRKVDPGDATLKPV